MRFVLFSILLAACAIAQAPAPAPKAPELTKDQRLAIRDAQVNLLSANQQITAVEAQIKELKTAANTAYEALKGVVDKASPEGYSMVVDPQKGFTYVGKDPKAASYILQADLTLAAIPKAEAKK